MLVGVVGLTWLSIACSGGNQCNGCLDSSGVCQTGDTSTACGKVGATCVACASGTSCQANVCAAGGTGGGNPGTGGGNGTGGSATGCTTGTCLSGMVSVPAGQTVNAVEVIACLPNTAGTDCDYPNSPTVVLSGSGTTGSFSIPVTGAKYLVFAAKDLNSNGTVEEGDLFGTYAEANGNSKAVTPPASDIAFVLTPIPVAQATLPAELVGNWTSLSSEEAIAYNFRADATFTYAYRYEPSSCLAVSLLEVTNTGKVSTSGTAMSLRKTAGLYKRFDCAGVGTSEPNTMGTQSFTWHTGTESGTGKTTLTLSTPGLSDVVLVKQ